MARVAHRFVPATNRALDHPTVIANDVNQFIRALPDVPWFLNLGEPHPRDLEVIRIYSWDDWPGPEGGWCDWLGRYSAVVRERIEADHSARQGELDALWQKIEGTVLRLASGNVPLFDPDEDAWHGPTTCVWSAAYTACLVSWHLLLSCPLPERVVTEWDWYAAGHWPCDFAEEPPGYLDESAVNVAAGKLLVY
jgi:hypothetical protein